MTAPVAPSPDETLRETMARLGGAQKGARGAPAYSRWVNRRVGRFFAAVAFRLGLTPNQVTALSAVFTFTGIALLALVAPTAWLGVVVSLLLLIGYALDSADGQLARLCGGGRLVGEWLDHMIDSVKVATLHLAVMLGLYRFDVVEDHLLLLPLAFSVVWSVHFFAMILNEQMRARAGATTRAGSVGERAPVLRSLLVAPTDYGVLCLVFLAYGATEVFLVLYGLLFLATAGFLALALVAWFREISGLDADGRVIA